MSDPNVANAGVNFESSVSVNQDSVNRSEEQIAKVDNANLAMLSNVRQGVQIGIFAIQAIGIALDQTITLMVEAVFLSIEVALEIQAALAVGTSGLSLLTTGVLLKGGTVISMIYLVYQLRHKKTESARRTSNIVGGLRMASFR